MIIFLNVLTIGGIADFYVRRLSLLYKLTALIFSFVVILILSAPPSSVSTIKNTLLRSYGTRALRHIRITVDIGYFENIELFLNYIQMKTTELTTMLVKMVNETMPLK